MQDWDAITLAGLGTTPLTAAPPSCDRAITHKLQLRLEAGGRPPATRGFPSSSFSTTRRALGALSAVAAVVLAIILIVTSAHVAGLTFLRRRPFTAPEMTVPDLSMTCVISEHMSEASSGCFVALDPA